MGLFSKISKKKYEDSKKIYFFNFFVEKLGLVLFVWDNSL